MVDFIESWVPTMEKWVAATQTIKKQHPKPTPHNYETTINVPTATPTINNQHTTTDTPQPGTNRKRNDSDTRQSIVTKWQLTPDKQQKLTPSDTTGNQNQQSTGGKT
jgi:hypothetical protein